MERLKDKGREREGEKVPEGEAQQGHCTHRPLLRKELTGVAGVGDGEERTQGQPQSEHSATSSSLLGYTQEKR